MCQMDVYQLTFSLYLSIGSVLERPIWKNAAQRTSPCVKWTAGARVVIIFDHSVARSLDRSIARSLDRSIARSIARSLSRSLSRSIARSRDRSIVRGLHRSIALVRSGLGPGFIIIFFLVRVVGTGPSSFFTRPVQSMFYLKAALCRRPFCKADT